MMTRFLPVFHWGWNLVSFGTLFELFFQILEIIFGFFWDFGLVIFIFCIFSIFSTFLFHLIFWIRMVLRTCESTRNLPFQIGIFRHRFRLSCSDLVQKLWKKPIYFGFGIIRKFGALVLTLSFSYFFWNVFWFFLHFVRKDFNSL